MGGVALVFPLERAPADAATLRLLQRDVWAVLYARVRTLASRKASRDVVTWYLAEEADDGFAKGSWSATQDALRFTFGDAAGLCDLEMRASQHWVLLAALDRWRELASVANRYDAGLSQPEHAQTALAMVGGGFANAVFDGDPTPALTDLLTGRSPYPLFFLGNKLAYAIAEDQPQDDCEVYLSGSTATLGELPTADRAYLSDLIRTGSCACELCEKLRRAHGLAPAPARQARRPAPAGPVRPDAVPAPRYDLASAPVFGYSDASALRADPSTAVALDLPDDGWSRHRTPASFIATLPRFPLRALGLRGHRMRELAPAVLELGGLEVLSLRDCDLRRPLERLSDLVALRGLDLSGNHARDLVSPELFGLPALEVVDYRDWGDELPPQVLASRTLRHLDLSRHAGIPHGLTHLPIESLVAPRRGRIDAGLLADLPLRYLEVEGPDVPPGLRQPQLEHLCLGPEVTAVPEDLLGCPALRALHVCGDVAELPSWLPELETLTTLVIETGAPDSLRVLERMRNLRVLVLIADGADRVSLDLSGLRELDLLCVSGTAVTRRADLPAGVETLPRLRRYFFSADLGPAEEQELHRQIPAARADDNVFRVWRPRSLYRAFAPRGSVDWYLARLGEDHWPDALG
jgi:hypothetical protein